MTYTINHNNQFNSIEIAFDGKPSEEIRAALKNLKFRWHSVKHIWYGFADEQTAREAIDGKPAEPKQEPEESNKFGVKVGDIFSCSWGWEQTNVNFFQVVALAGKTSVRLREVYPEIIKEEAVSGMAENRTYKLTRDILPAASRASFIHDQEKGDLKRITDGYNGEPRIKISSYASAYLCKGETVTEYVSWYA